MRANRVDVLKESDLTANLLEVGEVGSAGFADDVSGGFGLNAGPLLNCLDLEIILVTTEAPVAEVMFGEVFSLQVEFFDNGFIREAVFEHTVDLMSKLRGQACDFAVAAGGGLAGLELLGEVVVGGIGH